MENNSIYNYGLQYMPMDNGQPSAVPVEPITVQSVQTTRKPQSNYGLNDIPSKQIVKQAQNIFSSVPTGANILTPAQEAATIASGWTQTPLTAAQEASAISSGWGTGAGTSAVSSAAGAVAGFAGNTLANSIFGNDRGMGASVGGTVGTIAGTVFGGPIGAAIGSFAGNALGGMFGPNEPTSASEFTGFLNPEGGWADVGFASKRNDTNFAKNISGYITNAMAPLNQAGIDLSGIKIRGGFNSENAGGGFIDIGTSDQSDAEVAANRLYFNSDEELQTALNNLGDKVLEMKGVTDKKYSDFNPSGLQNQGQPNSIARDSSGVPMVQTRRPEQQTSFSNFIQEFRKQGNVNAA